MSEILRQHLRPEAVKNLYQLKNKIIIAESQPSGSLQVSLVDVPYQLSEGELETLAAIRQSSKSKPVFRGSMRVASQHDAINRG